MGGEVLRFGPRNPQSMSNGLGAGFAGLTLLAVLLGLATLLALSLIGVFVFRRRTDAVPRHLKYFSVAVLGGVILVAGFGVLALYDEAATLAALFLAIVLLPLAAVGVYVQRATGLNRLDTLATVGLAWSLPFLVGLVVTFGLTTGIGSTFDLAPAESRRLGLAWIASTVGGIVVVIGSVLLGKRVSQSLSRAPSA